jgi:hypothetical protein
MLSQQLELEAKCNVVKYGRDEDLGPPLKKSEGHEYHVA